MLELSTAFDILYNNLSDNKAPGLDSCEKSFFLTKALGEIIKNYFNPLGNKFKQGFDDTLKRLLDFSEITCSYKLDSLTLSKDNSFDLRAYKITLPDDFMFSINEYAVIVKNTDKNIKDTVSIIPISYKDYTERIQKPYKQPAKRLGWRIKGNNPELIIRPSWTPTEYYLRYVKRPTPIIVEDLKEYGVKIEGEDKETDCIFNEETTLEILLRAVEIALNTYHGDLKSNVELGNRSE